MIFLSHSRYQLARYFELGLDDLILDTSIAVHFIHAQLEMYVQN